MFFKASIFEFGCFFAPLLGAGKESIEAEKEHQGCEDNALRKGNHGIQCVQKLPSEGSPYTRPIHLADVHTMAFKPCQQAGDLWGILVLRVVEVLKSLHDAPNEEDQEANQGQRANQD